MRISHSHFAPFKQISINRYVLPPLTARVCWQRICNAEHVMWVNDSIYLHSKYSVKPIIILTLCLLPTFQLKASQMPLSTFPRTLSYIGRASISICGKADFACRIPTNTTYYSSWPGFCTRSLLTSTSDTYPPPPQRGYLVPRRSLH